jgi:hypothetical protein
LRAAKFGSPDCVRVLIDAGADKEAKNNVCHLSLFRQRFLLVFVILLSSVSFRISDIFTNVC